MARISLGMVISILSILLVSRSVDPSHTVAVLREADVLWVVAVLGLLLGDVLVRAGRWQLLLAPIQAIRYRATLAYVLVGYLANTILPLRLGELVRCHYCGDRERISRSTVLGTVVVERVVDTVVLVLVAALAILVLHARGLVVNTLLLGLALAALLVLGLALGIVANRLPGANWISARVAYWPFLEHLLTRLHGGLLVASRPRVMAGGVALSVAAWTATILAFAAAGHAVGIELSMGQAALLASGVNLATIIPAGPGYIGTFELATVAIAAALELPPESMLAVGILVHGCVIAITLAGGSLALGRIGWRRAEPAALTDPAS